MLEIYINSIFNKKYQKEVKLKKLTKVTIEQSKPGSSNFYAEIPSVDCYENVHVMSGSLTEAMDFFLELYSTRLIEQA